MPSITIGKIIQVTGVGLDLVALDHMGNIFARRNETKSWVRMSLPTLDTLGETAEEEVTEVVHASEA